jgi:hypothetical protein
MQRLLLGVVVVCAVIFTTSASADACGVGPRHKMVVAHGQSPGGVEWRVSAARGHSRGEGYASLWFEFPGLRSDLGWVGAMRRPLPRRFLALGVPGDVGSESGLSGFTARRVTTMVIELESGVTRTFKPRLPPERLRRTVCWMRHFRAYDVFLPKGADVVRARGFDRAGERLFSERADRWGWIQAQEARRPG